MKKKYIHTLQQQASQEALRYITRRHFLSQCTTGLGAMALGSVFGGCGSSLPEQNFTTLFDAQNPLAPKSPHFPGKVRSVIYLHMAGAPSQLELFDYKPALQN